MPRLSLTGNSIELSPCIVRTNKVLDTISVLPPVSRTPPFVLIVVSAGCKFVVLMTVVTIVLILGLVVIRYRFLLFISICAGNLVVCKLLRKLCVVVSRGIMVKCGARCMYRVSNLSTCEKLSKVKIRQCLGRCVTMLRASRLTELAVLRMATRRGWSMALLLIIVL